MIGLITPREPDFIHAVIKADNPIIGHSITDLLHKVRRIDWEACIARNARSMRHFRRPRPQHEIEIPRRIGGDGFLHLPHGIGNIANHFHFGEIDGINLRRPHRNVDNRGAAFAHEEGRLFDDVMAQIDDAIRSFDCTMDEIARRERRTAKEFGMPLVNHALAQLSREEGYAGFGDKFLEHLAGHRAVGTRANHENRRFGFLQHRHSSGNGFGIGTRSPRNAALDRERIGMLVGNILRKLDMRRTGFFFLGKAIGFAHPTWDVVA